MDRTKLAQMIDHTMLKPEATEADILKLCREAVNYQFWSVCINPCWVPKAVSVLRGQTVRVCAVAGFPLGASKTELKAKEAEEIVRDGGSEVDMVINIGWLRGQNHRAVEGEIAAVRAAIGPSTTLKVIVETALLPEELKKDAARIVVAAGADFVKTSTGFCAAGGATVDDVRLLKSVVGSHAKVKAAGGIRDLRTALDMIAAGADRIGASASIAIVGEN